MGEVNLALDERAPLFNSALETALRSLVVLEAIYPRACTLSELTWFDHLVVHTADIDGPVSLHPDLPSRGGELLVRRRQVDDGLQLLINASLATLDERDDGIRYQAGDDAPSFIELLTVPYCKALKERAIWLAEQVGPMSEEDLRNLVHERLGRWTLEFQGEDTLYEPSA